MDGLLGRMLAAAGSVFAGLFPVLAPRKLLMGSRHCCCLHLGGDGHVGVVGAGGQEEGGNPPHLRSLGSSNIPEPVGSVVALGTAGQEVAPSHPSSFQELSEAFPCTFGCLLKHLGLRCCLRSHELPSRVSGTGKAVTVGLLGHLPLSLCLSGDPFESWPSAREGQ